MRRLAVVAVLSALGALATAGAAEADPFTCNASAGVSTPARASGVTERIGDFLLACTGGTPTADQATIPAYTVQLFLNTSTTSRLLAGTWGEPLLLLDEPPPGAATLCATASGICVNKGNGTGATTYYVRSGGQNVDAFQGQVGKNVVTFPGVPIDPPPSGGLRVLRIANVRADASALGANPSGPPTPIVATVSMSAGAPGLPQPTQTAAFIQPAFTVATLTADGGAPLPAPVALGACADSRKVPIATLSFRETFATAFERRNVATSLASPTALLDQNNLAAGTYNTETGFYDHGLVGNPARGDASLAGLADAGTRLKATFSDVPAGAHVFVDTQSTGEGATVARLTASETGAYAPAGVGTAPAEVPVVAGTGTAVWEVLTSDPNNFDELRFGVYADTPANTPTSGGTAAVAGDLAPSSLSGAAATGPVPRFASAASASTPLFSMPECQPPPAGPADATAPVVEAAAASPKVFRVDLRGTSEAAVTAAKRPPKGTTLRYSLSEAARALFTVRRGAPGRRSGKRCLAPTRATRRGRRCVRYVLAGRFAVASAAGSNKHRFSGRIGTRKLRPGRYRTTLLATDAAGNRSTARRFRFTVAA